MKHLKNFIIAVIVPLIVIPIVCSTISAKEITKSPVSPALSVIASDMEMKKCGITDTDLYFTYNDFENFLQTQDFKSITVTALPSEFEGKLILKDTPVISNQVIYKKDLKDLKFSPASNNISTSTFHFSGDIPSCESSIKCTVFLLDEINTAPTISVDTLAGQNISTKKNIMVYSTLYAEDNENDSINYEIITQPEHGIVSLSKENSGNYTYTPSFNFSGNDKFEYVAVDCYGNRSESAWVEITVEKSNDDKFFTDMLKHEEHNTALKVTEYGIMSGSVVDGKLCFSPDSCPTKAEFISNAIKSSGIEIGDIDLNTGLNDDSDIPVHLKKHIAYAINTGIVSGTKTEQGVFLYPNSVITRAEAAVVVNNILNIEKNEKNINFSDSQDIPSWASDDINSLANENIIEAMSDGSYMPNSNITNIQAAKIFCNMYELKN